MSKQIDDGGPAFPLAQVDMQTFTVRDGDTLKRLLSGMTLRDYFAAKALQGILAGSGVGDPLGYAKEAYEYADAMLKTRK